MKTLTFAFAATLALLSFGACKKKSGDTAAATAKLTELKEEMCKCKDAKCAQDVSDKMTKWSTEQAKNQKEAPRVTEKDQKLSEDLGKCMQAALGTPAAGAPPTAAGADGLPAECVEYKATVDKLMSCQKLPEAQRNALKKAFDDASAGWPNMPPDAKAQLATACKQGTTAVNDTAKGPCGW